MCSTKLEEFLHVRKLLSLLSLQQLLMLESKLSILCLKKLLLLELNHLVCFLEFFLAAKLGGGYALLLLLQHGCSDHLSAAGGGKN